MGNPRVGSPLGRSRLGGPLVAHDRKLTTNDCQLTIVGEHSHTVVGSAPDRGGAPLWQADRVRSEAFDRKVALERLASEHFDVLVIGGGITGAGVALDAAARGLRTALVERSDFASGTSSRSSKLVHGGLRYLEQREFALVYEALRERQRLLCNAPHLVDPIPFVVPLFARGRVAEAALRRAYGTALWLYDLTGGLRIGRRHRRIGASRALELVPLLDGSRLVDAFCYWDARADDARLCLEVLRTAAERHGAVVANHAELVALAKDRAGQVVGGVVRARGFPHPVAGGTADRELEVRARAVVNATGVFADQVRRLDEGRDPETLRPAKGVHLNLRIDGVRLAAAAVLPVPRDRRAILVVPWRDGSDLYVGTTDTDDDGPLDDPACLPDDAAYVLDALQRWCAAPIGPDAVTGVWAGLRPLLRPHDARRVSARTADLSRRHAIEVAPSGLVTVTGGKLTTYRLMAEQTVDQVLELLAGRPGGLPQHVQRSCPTKRMALSGGVDRTRLRALVEPGAGRRLGVDDELLGTLVVRHGTRAAELAEVVAARPKLGKPAVPGLPYLAVELWWAARHEMGVTLEDLLWRRTRAAIRDARASAEAATDLAHMLASEGLFDEAAASAEAHRVRDRLALELERAGFAPVEAPAASS
jgi:glycerol-3-phosphate dehydrogenase